MSSDRRSPESVSCELSATTSASSGFPTCNMPFQESLLLDSRVLRDQELNERMQQRFASLSDVVNKLEETEVKREFLL